VYITFALPHLFAPGVSPRENAEGLRVLLDTLINLNGWFLRHHPARSLYESGVVYARTDLWEPIPALYTAGYHGTDNPSSNFEKKWGKFGDCKSLSAALIAQYRYQGKWAEPQFRFDPRQGSSLYHILVRTIEGPEDPSVMLGMGKDESAWFTETS
jgi:hypothetical protein